MCQNCGDCVKNCPAGALQMENGIVRWDDKRCVNCDACIKTCTHLASPKIRFMEVAELVNEIKKKRMFIRGITVSGGECMVHVTYLLELFREVKKLGLTCLIDSNGHFDFSLYPELLNLCDGVMLDVKAVDPTFHKQVTGCDHEVVLKNLTYLLEKGKLEEVRSVLLPRHDEQNEKTVDYVSKTIENRCRYKLIRYRHFGVREVGIKEYGNVILSEHEMIKYIEICEKNKNKTYIVV